MKLRNFQKDMPPEKRARDNKRDSMNDEVFRPEWLQVDRILSKQKEGSRVCEEKGRRKEKKKRKTKRKKKERTRSMNDKVFRPEWLQVDRILSKQKKGSRVCEERKQRKETKKCKEEKEKKKIKKKKKKKK